MNGRIGLQIKRFLKKFDNHGEEIRLPGTIYAEILPFILNDQKIGRSELIEYYNFPKTYLNFVESRRTPISWDSCELVGTQKLTKQFLKFLT